MELINHINEYWRLYMLVVSLAGIVALWWLSRYFASKKDFEAHVLEFKTHRKDHYQLRDLVHEINNHVQYLPTAQESQALRETMARLEGRLESVEPMFKQMLNQYNMLLENELRGEKK